MSLYTKEFLRLSDVGYSFLNKQLDLSLPSIYMLNKIKDELNSKFDIEKLQEGCFIDPKIAIRNKLEKLNEKNPEIFSKDRIKVKLSADGTNICRNIKLLNVVFSVIDEEIKAATASGSYLFALTPLEKENYDEIATMITKIWDSVKDLTQVEIGNVTKYIDLFVCTDYKMSLNLAGLKGANSSEPCIYCTAEKDYLFKEGERRRVLVDDTLTILDNGKKICEVLDEDFYDFAAYEYIKDENQSKWIHANKMLIKLPIFRFIIDLLHLFLRIPDKLFLNLIEEIKKIDKFSNSYDPKKHKSMTELIAYLKECKIPIHDYCYEENTISNIFTTLQGPSRIKVFERIIKDDSFLKLLKSMKVRKADEIYLLWKDFYLILRSIKSHELPNLDYTQVLINNWFVRYVSVYTQTNVTPYIHMFNYHLMDQYKKYGNINFFNTQGIEKLNDISTQDFFKATNKKEYCAQILQRYLRLDFLDSILKFKPKRKYTRLSNLDNSSNSNLIDGGESYVNDNGEDLPLNNFRQKKVPLKRKIVNVFQNAYNNIKLTKK
jgi:hypothetical protein